MYNFEKTYFRKYYRAHLRLEANIHIPSILTTIIRHTIILGKAPPPWLYEMCRRIVVGEIESKMNQNNPDFQLCFLTFGPNMGNVRIGFIC